jgi:hypothetical protein
MWLGHLAPDRLRGRLAPLALEHLDTARIGGGEEDEFVLQSQTGQKLLGADRSQHRGQHGREDEARQKTAGTDTKSLWGHFIRRRG